MSRIKIALATVKPKTFYIAVKILKRLNLPFRSCTPMDNICKEASFVITTANEVDLIGHKRVLIIDDVPDETTTALDVMICHLSETPPQEIIIGVDPGLHNGIAVLVDGTVAFSRVLASPIDTSKLIIKLVTHNRKRYPSSTTTTRIGIGSKLYSTLLLRHLEKSIPDLEPELVDERYTTIQGGYFKDQFSAEMIALRKGRAIQESDLIIEPKRGFIRGLQHLFRWLTDKNGDLSIESARMILADEITLSEALAQYHAMEKKRSTS